MTTMTDRKLTMQKAIAEGISQEMATDPSVFVMGEDVGVYGGIFGSTEGLLDKYGPERIIDTPISETGFIGAAVGAAINGMRPVVELMFVDFFGVCMDQIYNNMAKIHYFSGGNIKVPAVLMTAVGGGYSDAGQHSQTLWGMFAHLPGMKVVVPSSAYDAKGLMISAIRDDNPVVYMFHKGALGLGWMVNNPRATGPVPEEAYEVPIGKARVAREGSDVTIVTLGLSVHKALDAAETLEAQGISAEVIDLRSLVPLDREAVISSVQKTHRLLVVDEDYQSFGMSGEIITTAVQGAFDYLDAPPVRVTTPDIPIPYSHGLETWALPSVERIVSAAAGLVSG
ncbi:MAG: alpha-ketoacid dehydrogenase subunit beta [Acidimicrobiia bacterium]|nr:alpha-ketoacid dehydrogenase subunit beta [Acidimicrobiia bacterium]MDH5422391.1 alpha-ketoacid dehydrogenase subunit beta [Acidimicrobiia bacterium]MDH5503779.1 alpha-ketoacid dehydrogenase subunit beta [Acidimicrobiia bacterium]